jgi:hypothetical protein
MDPDEGHVAHPRLYGAPAYARPPSRVTPTTLPIDPDDLPIAVYQTPEEHEMVERLLTNRFGVAERPPAAEPAADAGQRHMGLGALAGKLLRRAS